MILRISPKLKPKQDGIPAEVGNRTKRFAVFRTSSARFRYVYSIVQIIAAFCECKSSTLFAGLKHDVDFCTFCTVIF